MKLVILSCLISVTLSAVAIYPLKVGEQLVLDLGPTIRTWSRSRNSGPTEFLKYCGPTEKGPRCAQFVFEDGKPAKPASEAKVHANGTLVIDNIQKTDAGFYFSDDEMERIFKLDDGYAMTPRTRITVTVN